MSHKVQVVQSLVPWDFRFSLLSRLLLRFRMRGPLCHSWGNVFVSWFCLSLLSANKPRRGASACRATHDGEIRVSP